MTDAPPESSWEGRTEWPLALAALVFLGAYAWPILDTELDASLLTALEMVAWVVWAGFAVDFGVRLWLADRRLTWLGRHLLDVAVLALPLLRPLRLLRLVTLLRVVNRSASTRLRGRVATYVAGGSVLLAFIAALAVLDAEREASGANITSFGDAMWWACATMTTVGYGDQFPVTATGRFVGVGLMIAGIALLGTVTATLASWLVDTVSAETSDEVDALRAEVAELVEQLRRVQPEMVLESENRRPTADGLMPGVSNGT